MVGSGDRTVTYREIAGELGISRDGAKSLVRRRVQSGRWHRFTSNDGTVRVHIPGSDPLPDPGSTAGADTGRTTPEANDGSTPGVDTQGWQVALDHASSRIADLQAVIQRQQAALDRERERVDRAEQRADQARQDADEARHERDDLRAELDRVRADLDAERAKGILARLLGR